MGIAAFLVILCATPILGKVAWLHDGDGACAWLLRVHVLVLSTSSRNTDEQNILNVKINDK